MVKLASFPFLGRFIPKLIHKKGPGAISSAIARTKYIDDILKTSINDGSKQVIILGAGFYTRSVRLPFLKQMKVIEINHSDTSDFKKEVFSNTIGYLPQNVSFQQVDFNKQTLYEVVKDAGINYALPTSVIREGVTNYLTQEAIDKTFEFTRQFISPFTIIFTYIDKDVLRNPQNFKGTARIFESLKHNEEQWTFGFNPIKLPGYLQPFGLTLTEDLNATSYRQRYIPDRKSIL